MIRLYNANLDTFTKFDDWVKALEVAGLNDRKRFVIIADGGEFMKMVDGDTDDILKTRNPNFDGFDFAFSSGYETDHNVPWLFDSVPCSDSEGNYGARFYYQIDPYAQELYKQRSSILHQLSSLNSMESEYSCILKRLIEEV